MNRLPSNRMGIEQNSLLLFSDFADNGPMWTGSGQRESRHKVTFSEAFIAAPTVMVGISMWDADRRSNLRADLKAENVTPEGFELVFRTWGDTRIARLRADWTAIGALRDEEFWDVD